MNTPQGTAVKTYIVQQKPRRPKTPLIPFRRKLCLNYGHKIRNEIPELSEKELYCCQVATD